MTAIDYTKSYQDHVSAVLERCPDRDEAFRESIGGEFTAVGKIEHYLLRSLGLDDGHLVVDVGCGCGRLSVQLAPFPFIRYVGCDVVEGLVGRASEISGRPDWRFVHSDGSGIPCGDGAADFVCYFSVFTHLLHGDIFKYIRESARVLKPGGRLVFSFLEFRIPSHWTAFITMVDHASPGQHLNQFIDRDAIRAWAAHTGFEVVQLCDGDKPHIPIPEEIRWDSGARMESFANLGQSVAVLRKS
jgi:ubiquinone/menaquinone biosynthesis C-methylase UbiE